ncbi:HXXEE domain-containing protein [Streptomyces sp. NPDC005791]|uniref:HXXEE domain-containing protein n=1 Tax=unclassified Streptomyces TaxID=2593676 RepID=UPI0033F9AAB2
MNPAAGLFAVYRGYTPGVVTAPLVVIPYSVWAVRRRPVVCPSGKDVRATGLALFPVVAGGVQGIARLLSRRR